MVEKTVALAGKAAKASRSDRNDQVRKLRERMTISPKVLQVKRDSNLRDAS
jgi:hypothetical protein